MNITTAQKTSSNSTSIILIKTGASLKNHPFIQALGKDDRRLFELSLAPFDPETQSHRLIVLPSGKKVIVVAAGTAKYFTHRKSILAMRHVIAAARAVRLNSLEVYLHDFETSVHGAALAELFAAQAELANFEFNRYKQPPKEGWSFVETLFVHSRLPKALAADALKRGKVLGEEMNKARTLANTPGGDMTPARLAEAAVEAGKNSGFTVEVLGEKEMKQLGMGGVLGVARGSDEPPKFIVMKYLRGKKSEKPVVLVGKGVTFDTGGLNIKPNDSIYEMHMDMSGGAAVIHTIATLARLKVKKNVIGLVPAVENMPSGSSYHPGDLLKTMSGKTIEVLNTDAEGRIILADALTYAKQFEPRLIIDVATLTGAAEVALGNRASALFATSERLEQTFRRIGEETGDFVWPLPLWEEYEEEIKGTFGDVANLGKTRYGGAITGAVFLWQFVKDSKDEKVPPPWVHLDIAPRMTTIEGEWLAKGAAGAAIYLLTQYVRTK